MVPANKARNLEVVLSKLMTAAILPDKTYLAGGTALYFQLHRRLSMDLDFFSSRPFRPERIIL
jgi:predicted nucleotidyltransferase component of viral defense system